MLLFEENESKEPPPKPEQRPTAAYLDAEHEDDLAFIRGAASPPLSKSEAIRQCIRLGARTLREKQAKQSTIQKKTMSRDKR